MWMSRRRWTRKAPRRIVGSAFRERAAAEQPMSPRPQRARAAAVVPAPPVHGTRARSAPAGAHSFAMRSRCAVPPIIHIVDSPIVACSDDRPISVRPAPRPRKRSRRRTQVAHHLRRARLSGRGAVELRGRRSRGSSSSASRRAARRGRRRCPRSPGRPWSADAVQRAIACRSVRCNGAAEELCFGLALWT